MRRILRTGTGENDIPTCRYRSRGIVCCSSITFKILTVSAVSRTRSAVIKHHITSFAAAIHISDGTTFHGDIGLSVDISSSGSTFTSSKYIFHGTALHSDVGVTSDCTEFAATIYIITNGAAAYVDLGTGSHAGGSTIAAAEHVGNRTAGDVDSSEAGDHTLFIGTTIDVARQGTIIHGHINDGTLTLVGATVNISRNGTPKNINITAILSISVITTSIDRSCHLGFIGNHNFSSSDII